MFSGLTNQVSSWMGKKQEEQVPSPTSGDQPPMPDDAAAAPKEESPTKAGGKGREMLGNIGHIGDSVKNQFGHVSSWLGGGIPGLSKGGSTPPTDSAAASSPPATTSGSATQDPSAAPAPVKEKDDDASRYIATGGADSDAPLSGEGSPTDEQATQLGSVSTKAVAGAKTFGNLLYSGFSKASKTVTEASAKIKKRVEETSILGELNKDQEAFIKEKNAKGGGGAGLPPWIGRPNQDSLRTECLSLSTDRRNFVRAPPPGVDFEFNFDDMQAVAMSILAEDPELEKMRFELVPKVINEENFWRNYFYRVSLICQANESVDTSGGSLDRTKESTDAAVEKRPDEDLSPTQEFVSDSFAASSADIEEVKRGLRELGITTAEQEEEWEKELEAELDNYEMVGHDTDKNLSVQIENMLDGSDIDDLK